MRSVPVSIVVRAGVVTVAILLHGRPPAPPTPDPSRARTASDDAPLPQTGDLLRPQAQLRQDCVSVLTGIGRVVTHGRRLDPGHRERVAHDRQVTEPGV